MPRKIPIKATPAQNREQYRKKKEHQQAERERRAVAREAEARADIAAVKVRRVGPGGTGRPFGSTTGGSLRVWAKRILGDTYTDTWFIRDFILLAPKDRLQFLQSLDPKNIGEGTPYEVAEKIKAVLDAINKSVPAPGGARQS